MHDDVTVIISQGYFRDVTKEDLADILPSFANPLEDPIFLIPPMGRPYTLSDEDEPAMRSVAGHQRNGGRPAHQQSLLKDRVSELKAQAVAEVRLEMNEQYPAGGGYHVTDVRGAQLFCLCAILCSSRWTCGVTVEGCRCAGCVHLCSLLCPATRTRQIARRLRLMIQYVHAALLIVPYSDGPCTKIVVTWWTSLLGRLPSGHCMMGA